eukprot:256682-Rhodomonas_salina.2
MRYVSTAHRVAPYAMSVPHIAWHHTLSQYPTSRSTIRCVSTAHTYYGAQHHMVLHIGHRIAPRYLSTAHRVARAGQAASTVRYVGTAHSVGISHRRIGGEEHRSIGVHLTRLLVTKGCGPSTTRHTYALSQYRALHRTLC